MTTENLQLVPVNVPALTRVLEDWRRAHPQMGVVALLPEAEQGNLPALQAVCRQLKVPLVGGIFPELLTSHGFATSGAWLMRVDERVPTFLVPGLGADPDADAARIAEQVMPVLPAPTGSAPEPQPTLFLVVDAQMQNVATLLDGLYLRLADRVQYAGVAAGSETFQPMPCLFDESKVIGDGALALVIPGRVKTILEHGFTSPERVMTATATVGNRIVNIDWKPAFGVYQEIVRTECGVELTRENFYQWAVHFPFGILRANGEVVVRIPVALTEDGCVQCIGEVPENAMLVVLRAPTVEGGQCIERLARGLGEANGPLDRANILTFYCAGRRLHLGPDAATEIRELAERTGAHAIAGALSLGELGSTSVGGYPLFHNATLVCTPWRAA